MRAPAPTERPVALAVAGSDSGGGAGLQADLQTMAAHGAYPTTAVTAVTAQHTRGVEDVHVLPPATVEAQVDAVAGDFDVRAVKTGMLATDRMVRAVTDRVAGLDAPAVVDPVMVAESGDRLLDEAAEAAYDGLVAEAAVVTPNVDEAAVLTGATVEDVADAERAGHELVERGADAALVTGGHVDGETVVDTLVTSDRVERFEHPRVDTAATHGSGCTLSSAVAARLARGDALTEAVETATSFLERAVRYHHDVGEGPGAVHHLVGLRERAAREPTAEAVHDVVRRLTEDGFAALLPEVGTNVVGATPYAESPAECAAVEGRLARARDGIAQSRGVRLGASSHVARFLLAAREFDPDLRFALNCRYDDAVADGLEHLDWPVGAYDREAQPAETASEEGNTMDWGARQAFGGDGDRPVAVVDPGAVGKEAMTKLVAPDPSTLAERALDLAAATCEAR